MKGILKKVNVFFIEQIPLLTFLNLLYLYLIMKSLNFMLLCCFGKNFSNPFFVNRDTSMDVGSNPTDGNMLKIPIGGFSMTLAVKGYFNLC